MTPTKAAHGFINLNATFTIDEDKFREEVNKVIEREVKAVMTAIASQCLSEALREAAHRYAKGAIHSHHRDFDMVFKMVDGYVKKKMTSHVKKYLQNPGKDILSMPFGDFLDDGADCGLSLVRILNCLSNDLNKNYQNITVADVLSLTKKQLLGIPNFGQRSLNIICEALSKHGLKLKEEK